MLSRWQGGLGALAVTLVACALVVLARAVAAQAAIVTGQAIRSSQAVSQVLAGSGDHETAGDEFRTYMMMLLVAAPVLIDARTSRNFLERAQSLGGEMVRALAAARSPGPGGYPPGRLDDAVRQLRNASAPLLQMLDPETRQAVRGDQPG